MNAQNFRIAYRMFYEAWQDIWRGGWSNWIVISILTSVLAIFGFVLQVSFGLKVISQKLSDQLEFSVYLANDVDVKDYAIKIGNLPHIKRVEVIDKDIAWFEFKKNFTIDDDFPNPLPSTLHVRVTKAEFLLPVVKNIKNIPGVVDINYAPGVLRFINKLKNFLLILGIAITILLAFVTVVIIGNTVQLVIHSRQSEIEVLRLMGVDDWYIRGPLVMQGIFYAIVAASIAITPLYILQLVIWEVAQNLIGSILPTGLPHGNLCDLCQIYYILIVVGLAVSITGCYMSTRKYLKI